MSWSSNERISETSKLALESKNHKSAARQIIQIDLHSLNQIKEFVNQTLRIRGMSQSEALSIVNLSSVSTRNKEYLFAEIIDASKELKKTVDQEKILAAIAKCLDDMTKSDNKESALAKKDSQIAKK